MYSGSWVITRTSWEVTTVRTTQVRRAPTRPSPRSVRPQTRAQRVDRARQLILHRLHRHAHAVGDLLMAQPLAPPQEKDQPAPLRQRIERAGERRHHFL